MYRGAEVKVGLIALLGLALLAYFAFSLTGLRPGAATYPVCVIFDNAQGLVSGDPVRLAGVEIGEVQSVELEPTTRKAKVYLSIHRGVTLYDAYRFQISTSGLIQERFVEVLPPAVGHAQGRRLEYGQCVIGVSTPGLNELIASGAKVLENLDRTAQLLRTTLSDQAIIGKVKHALDSIAAASEAAGRLVAATTNMTESTGPQLKASLDDVRAASADAKAVAAELRRRVEQGETLDNLEAAAQRAREAFTTLERVAAEIEKVTGDEQVHADLRGALADLRESAAAARRITADFEATSKEVRSAAPAIPGAVREMGRVAEMSQAIRERLKPPEINARFDVLYGPTAGRTYSSADLYVSTQPNRFLRLGIDDIGESSAANLQIGERQGNRILRYGLFRSRLGVGADLRVGKHGMLSVDVFDPNNLRADVLLGLPILPGRTNVDFLLGARDLGDENLFVAGARFSR